MNIKLYNGDCLELMKNIPDGSVDMILCDLPYGTTRNKWDCIIPIDRLWEQYKRIIKENGWIQISDEGAIQEVVKQIIAENQKSVEDYKAGKDRALGFLVGQAMKATKGKANPQMLNQMFKDELAK